MLGRIDGKDYGVPLIMDLLESHGLVADFFVEPFCSYKLGLDPLRRLCRDILRRGHGISLHLHPGWRAALTSPAVPCSDMMYDYGVDEQESLLREGLELFHECGVHEVAAFRAGNLAGNADTYEAMRRVGIRYSSNFSLAWKSDMPVRYGLPRTPRECIPLGKVWELPVTSFRDFPLLRPFHLRPLQIAAASARELVSVLDRLRARGSALVVLMLHSFEWLRRARDGRWKLRSSYLDRFHAMCRWLEAHQETVATCRFADLSHEQVLRLGERGGPKRFPVSTDFHGATRWISHAVAKVRERRRLGAW